MEIQKQAREVQYFFYSQAFADGLRATLGILLPALIGLYTGYFEAGLTISLGAMGVSLTDAPGPLIHKRNGMLICAGFAFVIAIITAYARLSPLTMGIEIVLVTFFFSMFSVYGNRATSVGNVAILIMILTMDKPVEKQEVWIYAGLILLGGLFYLFISLFFYSIRPYRLAQRALGDSIREIAAYLSIKADFYIMDTDLDQNYRRMVAQQIIVHEKQDAVRELLFKTRQIVKESTAPGRKLLFTFVETIDLFEDITATYYDYSLLRKQFGASGALDHIGSTLKKMAAELDGIGMAIQSNTSFTRGFDYEQELKLLKSGIDNITQKEGSNPVVLKKILVNLRNLLVGFNDLLRYFTADIEPGRSRLDHTHFVSHQSLDPKLLFDNISIKSSVFKHAIRVSLACIAGYLISKLIGYGQHSYWILLTIAFILKPAFSLTKQRNIERIIGTVIGGGIGILILVFIPGKTTQFTLMVILMIATYSFMRINYLVMVICLTPYVLILFSLLGYGFKDVALERVLDTVFGGILAFIFSYFLFPIWESEGLKVYMKEMVKANAVYLQKIIEALSGQKLSMLEYKLARKNVYLNSANLSAAFQRMLSEPKSKQRSEKMVHQFVVLNHILFSNIATITTTLLSRDARSYPKDLVHHAKKAFLKLRESVQKFGTGEELPEPQLQRNETAEIPLSPDDLLMQQQLQFIHKLSTDIDKTTTSILQSKP